VRVKNRLKSLYRSRGVPVPGKGVYAASKRREFLDRLPKPAQPLAELLYQELDALEALKREAKKAMLAEAKRHPEFRLVKSCPGLGPVRTAELLPIVVTPYRFQSKRGFWSYCGLGIVTRSSSDWVRTRTGEWVKAEVKRTRGLNRNFNHTLKAIFKGAATTVTGRREDEPIYLHYLRLLDGGTKPNLAKLTIARQIASIVLAVWRAGEPYDPQRLEGASKSR
jgi:transposase